KWRAGRFLSLVLGASLELGVWNWELVAWALSFSKIEMHLGNVCLWDAGGPLISRLHVRAHHSRGDTSQFLASLLVNDVEQLIGPGRGQFAWPMRDGALKISFAFERFDFAFIIAEGPFIKTD